MRITTFGEFYAEVQRLFQEGDYAAGLDLANELGGDYPEQAPLVNYLRMTLAARSGEADFALTLLGEALESGFWYSQRLLRGSPSFEPLQGMPAFEELVSLNARLQQADEAVTFPLLILRAEGQCLPGGPLCPTLIGLHTNIGLAQDSVEFWRPAAASGWLAAAPQSSQALWKNGYVWDDYTIAEAEVQKHFASLSEKYAVDPGRVVLAGHSMGGELAARLALSAALPVRGFIAFGPGGPLMDDPEQWITLVQASQIPGLRGYLVVGEEDLSVPHATIRSLADLLTDYGIPCEFEIAPRAGHDFAPEYEAIMLRALEFVLLG